MTARTITVVTGSRAEYGLLTGTMAELEHRDGIELTVIATGMHLSPAHGETVEEIRRDGFEITRTVDMLLASDSNVGMAKSLGVGISGCAEALQDIAPDIVLVLGDRIEAFAAAVAAAHQNIPVAHIHGGEAMEGATIDDSIRHALTKFAHIHFPATSESKQRILRLGEAQWRVTVVGAPGVDDILTDDYASPTELCTELGFDPDHPLVLVVQHPITVRPEAAGDQMRNTLGAVTEFDTQVAVIRPNSDAGGQRIDDAIEAHDGDVRTFANLPRPQYLGLLAMADVLVGNSSSGIIEAPSLDTPVVDVGPRQNGRLRAENVTSVEYDRQQIATAVAEALYSETPQQRATAADNPYEAGGAAGRIVDRLESITINDKLLQKKFVD